MFAPPLAKHHTTSVINSISERALQRPALPTRSLATAATQRQSRDLFKIPVFPQPSLELGHVDDRLEHEADRIADQALRTPVPKRSAPSIAPQRTTRLGAESAVGAAPDSVREVLRAPGQAVSPAARTYTELWDGLTTNQRRLLEALGQAGPDEEVLSDDFRSRHRLGAYATAERALESLVDRGLVERERRSRVLVPDVFLRHWLRLPSTI